MKQVPLKPAGDQASRGGLPLAGQWPAFLARLIPAFLLVAALLLLTNIRAIIEHRFPDPDDALRLLEVRDWLGGQGWFDLTQHRLDPLHGGVVMHWSRLVDMPLAGTILLLRPLLGADGAELAARILVPMLTLGVVMALLARIAWLRLGARGTTMTCLLLMMSPPFVTQILPMRIDHHGWQVACAVLALSGLLARRIALGAWLAGLGMAASLEISVEGLPLAAIFAAVGALRWFRNEPGRFWLAHYMAALASGSLLLFSLLRGFGDLAQHCDQMSPVQLTVLSVAALGSVAATALGQRWPIWGRVVVLGALGAVAGALYLGMAPQCRSGSFDMLSPTVRHMWYDQVAEGLPIWQQFPVWSLQICLPPLFAFFSLWCLIREGHGAMRLFWRDYALVLAGAQAVALLVVRAASLSSALTAIPLAWLVLRWFNRAQDSAVLPRIGWFVAIALAVEPSAPFTLYGQSSQQGNTERTGIYTNRPPGTEAASGNQLVWSVWTCHIDESAHALSEQPSGLILAGLDIAPELLVATHHTALASGHHRGARAMDTVIHAFLSPLNQAHAIIRGQKAQYVALCPLTAESAIYARVAPQGLAGQLLAGHVPGWLAPLPGPQDARLKVWRVVR
ncbi:hypothetical protein [Novosphingobium terrae]|uniref:hypothetical protein n=1 Tax=Novosphingobium terrae TaxID=2726189 RepID=UPI00197D4040|nr:hypothetical protein [Novosphingobium terrae]